MIGCKLQVSEKGVSVFCMYSACEACEVWQKKKRGGGKLWQEFCSETAITRFPISHSSPQPLNYPQPASLPEVLDIME